MAGGGHGAAELERAAAMSGNGQQVVVGVDGSDSSVAALNWAAQYASSTGAKVRAVLAWHYPTAAAVPPVGAAPESVRTETEEHMSEALRDALAQVSPAEAAAAIETRTSYGHPAEVLIEESRHADLLVVGSRGHGAFTGMLVGSVSIHCVTGAFCPVVVVRER
jgi:nucleotide-binding universal stress UspA family protein